MEVSGLCTLGLFFFLWEPLWEPLLFCNHSPFICPHVMVSYT